MPCREHGKEKSATKLVEQDKGHKISKGHKIYANFADGAK